MLVIRLQRTGRENTPTFRIVVSEKTKSAKSGMQEIVGHFIPNREIPVFEVKQDRIEYWVSKGAQPSDTLARHLRRIGMKNMDKFIIRYAKQKSRNPEAAPAAAAPAPVATPVPPVVPATEEVKAA